MLERSIVITLLSLVTLVGYTQSEDLWRAYRDTALSDSVRASSLQTLAWKVVFEKPDSGISLASELLRFATSRYLPAARYDAHTTLAVASSMKSQPKDAMEHLQECLRTA